MKNNIVYHSENTIYINLTNRCDNNCDFCIRNHTDDVFGYNLWLDNEPTAEEIIEELKKYDLSKYVEVVYCGFGEPTFRIEVIKSVSKYLKNFKIKKRINTNGHGNLINGKNIIPELLESVDVVNVSLNEVTPKAYDDICHSVYGEEGFYEMIEFAKECVACGSDVVLSIVDCVPNETIQKARVIANEIGARLKVREMT